jgi:hypothetical protein
MQRLDAPVHDLGKAGVVVDRADGDAGLRELSRGPAGRNDLDPQIGKAACEVGDAALVGNRQQRTLDLDVAWRDRVPAGSRVCTFALRSD